MTLEALREGRIVRSRTMIVVAHPDDETIGMGAQLCRFRDALMVQVTDGAPRDGRDAAARGFARIMDYAFARRVELYAALQAGLAAGVRLEAVGIPDQEACFDLVALTQRILRVMLRERPDTIFVLPYEGGHPDHDAAAFAVRAACRLMAAERKSPPAVIEMTSYHADGPGIQTGTFLPSGYPEVTLMLKSSDRSRKHRMIDCFATQSALLTGFGTAFESFRQAPEYDFTQPPHPGELHYERLGWNVTGALWRDHADAALAALELDAPPCG